MLEWAAVAKLVVVCLEQVSHCHIELVVEKHACDLEMNLHSRNWQMESSEERVVDHCRDLGLVYVYHRMGSALPVGLGCGQESRLGRELVSCVSVSV